MAKKAKHNLPGIISLAFQKLFKNYIVAVPFIFDFVVSFVVMTIALLLAAPLLGLGFNDVIAFLMPVDDQRHEVLIEKIISALPSVLPSIIVIAVVAVLVLWFAHCYFDSGAIGMVLEIAKGKKTSLETMHYVGKKFWFRYWVVSLVVSLFVVVWLAIFSIPALLTGNLAFLLITILSLVPLFFAVVLFTFSYAFLVFHNMNAWSAIKQSIFFVKANYWFTLGLVLFSLLISSIAAFIPYVGSFVYPLIISPLVCLAYVFFVVERAKRA